MSSLALFVLLLPVWAYLAGVSVAAARFSRRRVVVPATQPAVSLLKPLYGDQPGLVENLRSFADQDYPAVQIVLGARSPADPALAAARALIRDRPESDIALVIDPRARGSNLKIANLENMLPAARHEFLVLADSDMRVGRDYLATIAAPLHDPATGVVTCLYKGVSTGGLWSDLGALHINYGFLPSALVAEALGAGDGCFGATIALRRDVLDRIGGLARVRDELADDHRIGQAAREQGLAIVLSPYLVENQVAESSLAGLWRHELRWARTVRAMAPLGHAGSVLTHSVVITALAAAIAAPGLTACGFVLICCGLRWASAAALSRWLGLPAGKLWLLPLRDALSFVVFVASFCGRGVHWGDRRFRVAPDGRMSGGHGPADGDGLG